MSLVSIIAVSLVVATVAGGQRPSFEPDIGRASEVDLKDWVAYKEKFDKVYDDPAEDADRFALFQQARRELSLLSGAEAYGLGITKFSDWTAAELKNIYGFRMPNSGSVAPNTPSATRFLQEHVLNIDPSDVPDALDWRKVPNRVGPVKDQGSCGSCWTFAATGLLEGQQFGQFANYSLSRRLDRLEPLSEQNIIDCSGRPNKGCHGGLSMWAFMHIDSLGGIESSATYPYEGTNGECRFRAQKSIMRVTGYSKLPDDEERIKAAVAAYGPVAVAINANGLEKRDYGIFLGQNCTSKLNHEVLVVGYDTDPQMGDFWIIKNSWGAKWGDKGYFRMARGRGICGFGTLATIATLT